MLQLDNQTPFKASIAVLPDKAGIDTLYVVVKATLTLQPSLSLAPEQIPVTMADEYYGEPALSSLKAVSEMHIGKAGTDVLLIGQAHAPAGRPVARMGVSLSVAERSRQILVSGDRTWQSDGTPGAPVPFESMPLVWERAYGGFHRSADRTLAEERNPVGCGFAGERSAGDMKQQRVPNLEDPSAPLQKVGQICSPVCFAPTSPSWLPRRTFAGTYDEQWQRSRAPYLPDDFDHRFLQCAPPEFAFDRYLQGGERVRAEGCSPQGPIDFTIPASPLVVAATIAGAVTQPQANLETMLLEPDANRLCMTWRAAVPCDRQVLKVEKIALSLAGRQRA
jgi:hypothetical protein